MVDLFNINSLTNIDSVSIAGTTGADTINLSPSLTTDGITTIDLKSDTAADKIYFGVSETDYKASGTLGYTTVSNFNTSHDRVGLYYYDFSADSGSPAKAINKLKRTGSTSGTSSVTVDRTLVEDDTNFNMTSAISDFDAASQIKTVIAEGVATTSTDANRLMFAHYVHDESGSGTNYAIVNAADFTGVSGQSDLAATTSPDFEVVGVAKLVGVSAGALDLMSNFTQTKPSGVEGA